MLNAYYSKINNWEDVCYVEADADDKMRGVKKGEKILSPFLETLVMATMLVDLGEVTEKNLDEWQWRIALLQVIGANPFQKMVAADPGDCGVQNHRIVNYVPTTARIKVFVGLRTNVPSKTRRQWWSHVKMMVEGRTRDELRAAGAGAGTS